MSLVALLLACADPPAEESACEADGGAAATSRCLAPAWPEAYYAEQGDAYFDTLETDFTPGTGPAYADGVARWEWPPWLKLTGWGREEMETIDAIIRLIPTEVPVRDCRAFPVQPFARCRVSFAYADHPGEACPIYEEFTFDDAGRITFIEAWSDDPDLLPAGPGDDWAESEDAHRLSTRLPGLGGPDAALDLDSPAMAAAAASDPEIADFMARARDFHDTWLAEYEAAGDVYAEGCGW